MKKFIFSAIAAIGLLLSPSCSDENEALSGSGNEALVSFSVNLADGVSTKAISDGTKATNLVVEVYESGANDGDGEIFREKYELVDLKKTVAFNLVKGKQYDIIFWAQMEGINDSSSDGNYYDVSDLRHIKINYDANGGTSNSELRDAFLCVKKGFSVKGPWEEKVWLRRPFAQVNFMVPAADIKAAKEAGFDFGQAKTSVTFKQAASTLNTLENTATDPQDVIFAAAPIPFKDDVGNIITSSSNSSEESNGVDKIQLPNASGQYYYYLATNYILVNSSAVADVQALTNAYLVITEPGTVHKLNASNLPVQWNYRTNIYGSLLTAESTFNVEISPAYETPDHGYEETVTVDDVDAIAGKISSHARTITCTAAINQDVTISIPKVFEAYTDGVESDSKVVIRFTGDIASGKKVRINYGSGDGSEPHFVDITANGGDWHYELAQSTVTMNGGTVESVTSTTYQNTLIISKDLTVSGSITAYQGGVKILGKVLGQNLEVNGAAITMAEGNIGNLEIQGEVNGSIQSNSTTTEVTITPTATVTGSVETKGNITVQGSVTDNVKSTGENTKVVIEETAQVGGNIDGDVELSPKADVNESMINKGEGSSSNTFTTKIGTADELIIFAAKVNAGTYASKAVELTKNINLSGVAWTPLIFSGDITINGNGHTIQGLDKALVLRATIANITINNLTIAESHISYSASDANETALGVGGFISYQDYAGTATFNNCHLKNSTVNGSERAAGLIGYTSGNQLTITNCTVENCNIKATGGTGGLVAYTQKTVSISGSKVENSTIESTEDRSTKTAIAGGIIGTIVGATTFDNVTVSGNTVKNTGAEPHSDMVGRVVSPGTLTIDGVAQPTE